MKNHFITLILISLMLSIFTSCSSQSEKDKAVIEYTKTHNYSIKSDDVKNADPAILFCYSNYLWETGQKDDAVFWYYVAQYRYRILSSCSEKMKAGYIEKEQAKRIYEDSDGYRKDLFDDILVVEDVYRIELYERIQKVLGAKINGYAYGDLEQMKSTLSQVLEYEEKYPFNPMSLDPKPVFKSEEVVKEKLAKVKESYIEQKQYITEKADYIKAERTKNGLENRK